MGFEDKLNNLATAINNKTGSVGKKTLDQLATAVTNLNTNGLITKNNIISNKDVYAFTYSSFSCCAPQTTWTGGGSGKSGSYWFILCTIPAVEDISIQAFGGNILDKTYYLLGTYAASSSTDYMYSIYLYLDKATKNAYILFNSRNSAYDYNYIFYYNNNTYCIPYIFPDIIIKTTTTLTYTAGSFRTYSSSSWTFTQYVRTGSSKSTAIVSDYDSAKRYTLVRGFYFTTYNTINLISSELEEAS